MVSASRMRDELADREAIRECLYRYSRGVDRLDEEMLRSAYWPDAIDDHLGYKGDIEGFIAWAFPIMRTMDQTSHLIGNVMIAVNGDSADVESYFHGFQRINLETGKSDVIAGGRYIDRFERRGDEWRIIERYVQTDWFRQYPDSADWSQGMLGLMIEPGGRSPDDASYTRLSLV